MVINYPYFNNNLNFKPNCFNAFFSLTQVIGILIDINVVWNNNNNMLYWDRFNGDSSLFLEDSIRFKMNVSKNFTKILINALIKRKRYVTLPNYPNQLLICFPIKKKVIL